jgi:hypothetical protein
MDKNILYYGRKESLLQKIYLRAGELDLVYENGFLRYIKIGQDEVVRMINHAVRDHNWNTIPFEITEEEINISNRSFSIKYIAEARQGEVGFLWACSINGFDDSSVNFSIDGEALTSFKRNRLGFTVLHPIRECVGRQIKIIHPDGKSEIQEFPVLISPHQPFFDIKSMEWSLGNNNAFLEFTGDIFETEDQRNWIDESYKTYCTPLDKPYPVEVKKGDQVKQEIRLKVDCAFIRTKTEDKDIKISIESTPCPLPKIGICQSSEVSEISSDQINKLKEISFDHYRVDLKLYDEGWIKHWERIKNESESLRLPLELSLFFDKTDEEILSFSSIMETGIPMVSMVNIFDKKSVSSQKETISGVLHVLKGIFPKAEFGAGTNAFFTELNRGRPPMEDLDYLVYSISPQVHAFDNDSLIECTYSAPYTIRTAKEFSNNKPVNISPVTFRMRWNPYATSEATAEENRLPDNVDPRQMSLFGASWLVGLLNNLLAEKPKAISFFETIGMKGIMQSSTPLYSDQFVAPPGMLYPLYFIFRIVLEQKSNNFYRIYSSQPDHCAGLAWGKNEPATLLLVNFTTHPVKIRLPDQFHYGSVLPINENSIEIIMNHPDLIHELRESHKGQNLDLSPFGISVVAI